jgi:predicted phosphodiesterase
VSTKPKRIAVLSDLHLGNARREMEYTGDTPSRINYLDIFSEFARKEEITADYIVIPGDISDKGKDEEFREFDDFISVVSSSLETPRENIIISPGNHDKNWAYGEQLKDRNFEERLAGSYKPYLTELSKILNTANQCRNSHASDPYFKVWEDDCIYCITFNSAVEDFRETQPHYGTAQYSAIKKLEQQLNQDNERIKDKLKLFICHHHPIQYSSPLNDLYPDFSIMGNAEGVLSALHDSAFDFVIHGHKHIPNFHINANHHMRPLICFCAGSFSANLPHEYQGISTNLFHIIETSKAPSSNTAKGKIYSWAYLVGHGWHTAKENITGIDPMLTFGNFASSSDIEKRLRDLLSPILDSGKHSLLKELYKIDPDLEFTPNKSKRFALEKLSKELGFQIIPHDDDFLIIGD